MKYLVLLPLCVFAMGFASLNAQQTTFAIIGNFGTGSNDETDVANLIKS